MKKSAILQRNLEIKLQMVVKRLWRSLRKLMNTKHAQVTSAGKCQQLSVSCLCSKAKHLSFSKKRRRRSKFSKKRLRIWKVIYLQHRMQTLSGTVWKEIQQGRSWSQKKGDKENCSSNNCLSMELKVLHCLDQIHTCLQTFKSQDHMVYLLPSNHRSQVHRCVTL